MIRAAGCLGQSEGPEGPGGLTVTAPMSRHLCGCGVSALASLTPQRARSEAGKPAAGSGPGNLPQQSSGGRETKAPLSAPGGLASGRPLGTGQRCEEAHEGSCLAPRHLPD